jgi:diaminohydroxyphosphoribosylaminopyrimidine deaminase/5-amino-6-(5-phosphoribosylamino)uracil reductase
MVHCWRSEEDAFLVGTQTAENDNPRLNVREWSGRDPLRIVIDRSLRLSKSLHLFDGTQPTIVYNTIKNEELRNLSYVKIADINDIVRDLFKRKIQSLVVEGGAKTLQLFISSGLWDEARVFTSPLSFNFGVSAPDIPVQPSSKTPVGDNNLWLYQNLRVTPLPVK